MSDWAVLGIFWGLILAWFVYRWFRPSPQQRAMIALYERTMAQSEEFDRKLPSRSTRKDTPT